LQPGAGEAHVELLKMELVAQNDPGVD
jgi:hypothetical protein